jgi:hypothetical protein
MARGRFAFARHVLAAKNSRVMEPISAIFLHRANKGLTQGLNRKADHGSCGNDSESVPDARARSSCTEGQRSAAPAEGAASAELFSWLRRNVC